MATKNAINSDSPIEVAFGGTGQATLTDKGVLVGNGTSGIAATVAGTTGQILTGVTSGVPTFSDTCTGNFSFASSTGGGLTVTKVANGLGYVIVLASDGSVWGCGANSSGQLGLGHTRNVLTFTKMIGEGESGCTDIACGSSHTIVIKSGVGYATGYNFYGSLGVGDNTNRTSLTAMVNAGTSGITQVDCLQHGTIARKADVLYGTGRNNNGQLCIGNYDNKNELTIAVNQGASGVTNFACGSDFTIAVKSGVGYGSGFNGQGQLGTNDFTTYNELTAMTSDGTAGITAVACGFYHTMCIKTDAAYGTGDNLYGQLGLNDNTDRDELTACVSPADSGVTALSCGKYSSFILKGDIGYSTGANIYGELGTTSGSKKVFTILQAPGDSGVSSLISHNLSQSTYAIKSSSFYACGYNSNGELATRDVTSRSILTQEGNSAGGTRRLLVTNTDNTNAASNAVIRAEVGGTAGGDPYLQTGLIAISARCWGAKNDTGDAFQVRQTTPMGGFIYTQIETTGEMTKPLQSAFMAYLGSTDSNVTGDGTSFTIGKGNALTEVFDLNSDFNTNGTFTAPVTGRYILGCCICIGGMDSANALLATIVTSNRTYYMTHLSGFAIRSSVNNYLSSVGYVLADMDAADTASFKVQVSGDSGKVSDVIGGSSPITYVYGFLAC